MPLSDEQIKQLMDIAKRLLLLIEYIYRNTESIKLDKLEKRGSDARDN